LLRCQSILIADWDSWGAYTIVLSFGDRSREQENFLQFAVRCPECGSSRVEYPQFTRKFVTPTLVEIFTVLAPGVQKRFYCVDCQHTWAKNPEADPEPWDGSKETDVLGWRRKK
jgi:hypothetical protein